MLQKLTNQKGFTAIETLLVIIIIAIIGGTGYYVYQSNNKTTDTQNDAHTAAESAAVTSTTGKSTAAAGAQAKLVYANLLKAFNKNGAAHQDWDVTYVDSAAGSKEFTKDFKTAVDGGTAWDSNGVFCTATYNFDDFTVGSSSISGDTATVTLLQAVKAKKSDNATANAQPTPMKIKLTLQYGSGKWLVDKHECVSS